MRNRNIATTADLPITLTPVLQLWHFIQQKKRSYWLPSRGKNPAKGTLDLSGGFIDMNETGEEGVSREVKEETGLIVTKRNIFFSLPAFYLYSGFLVHTLDLFFSCKVEDDTQLKAMDDVAESFWVPIKPNQSRRVWTRLCTQGS